MRILALASLVLLLTAAVEAADTPATDATVVAASGDAAGDADTEVAADWPRVFTVDGKSVTLYQPQPEKLTGNTLTERAAVSVQDGDADPVFGALWLTATLDIDREQRVATVDTLTLNRMRFPDGEAGNQAAATLQSYVAKAVTPKNMVFDLDSLMTTLDQAPGAANAYQVAPPTIFIRTAPTELLLLDGDPKLAGDGAVKRVVNTPAFLCVDAAGTFWLMLSNNWLKAAAVAGPWTVGTPSAAIQALATSSGLTLPEITAAAAVAPAIILGKEPVSLVVFNGEPSWTPVGDTGLLGSDNCDANAFRDTATQRCWLLLAGRWYSSDRFTDQAVWTPCAPNELPAAFAAIPADSRWGTVRASIAGTDEAHDAAMDAQIPQTARIPLSETITVTYDGEPRFVTIPNSTTTWAENSAFAVFQTPGPMYYCCSNAVWYQSKTPQGPWSVCTAIPDALHAIPPSNPYHTVSYVYIYQSTPTYVWCGYTSGYMGCYIYRGVPIYGSGWYYHGYYGPAYYCPRPVTFAVRVAYNPWTGGWGVAVGVRAPAGGIVVVGRVGGPPYSGGWWGPVGHPPRPLPPPGYRPPPPGYRPPAYRPPGAPGGRPPGAPGGRPPGAGVPGGPGAPGGPGRPPASTLPAGKPGGAPPRTREADAGIYDRVPGAKLPATPTAPIASTPGKGRDDRVFADKDGSVVRRDDSGNWQQRENKSWKSLDDKASRPATQPAGGATPTTRPATGKPAQAQPSDRTQQLDRSYQQRKRSSQRSAPAQRSSSSSSSRPSGGGGGGGGGGTRAR